jgi:hypothetical protein
MNALLDRFLPPSHLDGGADEAIRIYPSKIKHVVLVLPCLYVMVMGYQLLAGGAPPDSLNIAMLLFGSGATVVLLFVGFSKNPVLVIDGDGVYCRRPDFGLIPWEAVTGLGLGRAAFSRSVLIIALDEEVLSQAELERLKRERGSLFMNPQMARFRGDMAGHPTLQISISLLAVSARELRAALEKRVNYEGAAKRDARAPHRENQG